MPICNVCKKNPASVHVTEIEHFPVDGENGTDEPVLEQKHICDKCAQRSKIPYLAVTLNKGAAVWKMLEESARRQRAENAITCPECGMTLAEFKSKGRLGCPRDYEVFGAHVGPLLLRIHNATAHKGRVPGGRDDDQRKRRERLSSLREELARAIREEEYENAARLRDEIQGLETSIQQTDEAS